MCNIVPHCISLTKRLYHNNIAILMTVQLKLSLKSYIRIQRKTSEEGQPFGFQYSSPPHNILPPDDAWRHHPVNSQGIIWSPPYMV